MSNYSPPNLTKVSNSLPTSWACLLAAEKVILSIYVLMMTTNITLSSSPLIINLAFIPVFIKILKTPFTILAPIIFVLCLIGGYAPTESMHDVWLMIIFGIVGYLMRKLDYPLAPAVLAIVLGPLAEPALRQSLIISDGEFSIFFTRTYSGPIMVVAILLLFLPLLKILCSPYRGFNNTKATALLVEA